MTVVGTGPVSADFLGPELLRLCRLASGLDDRAAQRPERGEHGDGYARSALNPRLFGPTLYGALQQVKRTFDPDGLMNPGKVV